MSQAGDLLNAAREFLADQFPATITIDGQGYGCATSGISNNLDLAFGGALQKGRVAFWLATTAFTDASKPEPLPRKAFVTWNETKYSLEEVKHDPAAATLILICLLPEQ